MPNSQGVPQWHARFTRADKSRTTWLPLDPTIPPGDEARARTCAAWLASQVKHVDVVKGIEPVASYAERWLADREGRIVAVADNRSRMRLHILPLIGECDVRTFSRNDVEAVRDSLDAKIASGELAWGTAAGCWHLLTTMCRDAMSSKQKALRVRDDNPCRDVKPPETGEAKAKQYLYPSEFLAFVSCERVPLRWRRAVALAVYTYAREGELRALRWDGGDLDMDHGTLAITRAVNTRTGKIDSTKSGETRRFAVEAELLPLLRMMKREAHGRGPMFPIPKLGNMADRLRRWLKRAGVTRPELHNATATSKAITWHDLRATGITWMAVRGDAPLTIKQRAGHSAFSTTEVYIRTAEAIRAGFGVAFPPLPACLLGRGASDNVIEASVTEKISRSAVKQARSSRNGIYPELHHA
jgi:integrase